ncbi:hypothetical protein GCM10018790_08060 [Kitasatospora xanthocidica]|uniref:hypothetical protein n=1 Tax=Kitasatospora xanthocidica TaxID=83382 RepID=UPI001679DB1A|nr:hypothetical protein [Kitasatospora xanthocidica]GHF32830.1 hypothetical protein GCM10018790_08060 [Kitasatospora xanthocidica]
MAETTAVSGGPDPASDSGPWDAVPPPPRLPAEEHPPGPAALYEPPPAPPAVTAPAALPERPLAPPAVAFPAPQTGWTLTGLPAAGPASSATPPPFPAAGGVPGGAPGGAPGAAASGTGGLGAAPRGRILVIEGGYGNSGRRTWGRGGPTQAPVLSAMLAAVSPQVLLAADAVDAVHLPGASDTHTVLAHLRAASRHPGPLLVHVGGHVVADKRGGQLQLTLRDAKQDGLPWQAVAAELAHRPAEWQTLVIADLSADQNAWPYLQGTVSPLSEGIPLWAVVSPDPEQIGTFTRALIEALHGGRPGAGEVLAPEQLRQQVYSVLRPDVVILATHAPDRPFFRNTARRGDGPTADLPPVTEAAPFADPVPFTDAAPFAEAAPFTDAVAVEAPPYPVPLVPRPGQPQDDLIARPVQAPPVTPVTPAGGPVSLVKPGVPPTPPRPARPVSLLKAGGSAEPVESVEAVEQVEPGAVVEVAEATAPEAAPGVTLRKPAPADTAPADTVPTDTVPEDGAFPAGVTLLKERPEVVDAEPESGTGAAAELPQVEDAVPAEAAEEPRDAVPAGAGPTDEAPADEAPTAELFTDEAPTAELPTDEAPTAELTAEDAPTAELPTGTVPQDKAPVEEAPADDASAAAPPRADYREVIGRIVRSADAGDHAAATDLAFALELEAIAEHGAVSEPVLQVRQVRAHVCRLAGRSAEAADIYREVALTLLRSQGPDHPETQQAATNAEACWRSITDRAEAIRIAPEIIELRAYLPGPEGRKLRAAERYLAQLAATG